MGQGGRRRLEPVAGETLTITAPGQVVRSVIHGQPVHFFISNPRDSIQKVHATGQFYEMEELEIIRKWCPPGAVFCDIGSNVGNHAIYALKFLHASRVILCEPNPIAIQILLTNLGLNGLLDRCDTSRLGYGVSDRNEGGMVIKAEPRNLGGGKIQKSEEEETGEGGITLRRGDELLADVTPDFVKIDVEGMEMSVLEGLAGMLARCRPVFFVEVENANREAFEKWMQENGYATRARFRRYRANENFLIVPQRRREAPSAEASPMETQQAASPLPAHAQKPAADNSKPTPPSPSTGVTTRKSGGARTSKG